MVVCVCVLGECMRMYCVCVVECLCAHMHVCTSVCISVCVCVYSCKYMRMYVVYCICVDRTYLYDPNPVTETRICVHKVSIH